MGVGQVLNSLTNSEAVGVPLVRLSLTKGMIAADFLGDPTGTGLDMPSQTHRASGGLTAGSCGPFLFGCNSGRGARRLYGSTKLAGAGRLWMMRCAPLISIVAQSVSIELILPPEASVSQPRSSARSAHAAMYELPVRPTVLRPAPVDLPRVPTRRVAQKIRGN